MPTERIELVLFLAYVGYIFWKNRKLVHNFYYLGMMVTFVGSFFGAGLMVDPVFWFFLGVNAYMAKAGHAVPIAAAPGNPAAAKRT